MNVVLKSITAVGADFQVTAHIDGDQTPLIFEVRQANLAGIKGPANKRKYLALEARRIVNQRKPKEINLASEEIIDVPD